MAWPVLGNAMLAPGGAATLFTRLMYMRLPAGFIPPCLPTKAQQPPSGEAWLHEIMPSFDRIRYRRHDASVFLYAFDLIELNGDDLRREPLDTRKATLASVLRRAAPG